MEQRWILTRPHFLLPVRALSRLFRSKLQQALAGDRLLCPHPTRVWQQEWVVHCEDVGSVCRSEVPGALYFPRCPGATTGSSSWENDRVTFRYRDTETGAEKRCSLGGGSRLHPSFLQHVLPHHFVKVRYYGFFAPTRRARLTTLRQAC